MAKKAKMTMCRNCNEVIAANVKKCPVCGEKNKKPFYKKWWFILLIVVVVIGVISSMDESNSSEKDKKSEYKWPSSELASMIPQPDSQYGEINSESEKYFSIDVYDISDKQFEDYIEECKEYGFDVDYNRSSEHYSAKNKVEYQLTLSYDGEETELGIRISAPAEEKKQTETTESKEAESTENNSDTTLVDGMRPEFKEAMDSYEKFYNEYCDILKKYSNNPLDVTILAKYTELLSQLEDVNKKFEAWEDSSMNDAELKYYLDVSGRITKKLLEVGAQ